MALEALRRELLAKGGLGSDWHKAVTRGLSAEDVAWNDGEAQGEAVLDIARACMTKDALVEYECYNDQRRPQGRAVMVLRDWEGYAEGILVADHLKASDPYYEWYGNAKLKNGGGVYHLCGSKLKDCPMRLSRADRRELVHVQRWRMVNPLIMAENEYMKPLAIELVRDWVQGFVPAERVPEPAVGRAPGPPGGGGGDHTGLDRAAEEARKGGAGEDLAGEGQRKEKKTPEKIEPRGSVGALLERRAAEQREAWRKKESERRRKNKERGRSRLLKSAMKELQRYLGDRAGTEEGEDDWPDGGPQSEGDGNLRNRSRSPSGRKVAGAGRFDDPEIESSGNVSRRPVMADCQTSGVDTPHRHQPHGGARKTQSSASRAGPEQAEKHDGQEQGPELEVGRRRRGQGHSSRDATPERRGSAEEKSRAETGEVRRQAKGDPERSRRKRRETSRRAEAGERSSGSRRRRKRKREETKAVLEEGQEGKRQRRGKEAAGSKPHSPEASYEQESFETTAVTPDAGHLLETMKAWLKSEECGGLSIAQNERCLPW
eukprot:s18_g24.t1